jgi:UDP-glucuronate decarboxylase
VRVLIAGGAGFIGSNLTKRLIDMGHYVLVVDNYCTSQPSNLNSLRNHNSIEIIRHDINFPLFIEVDAIFNLACPASPIQYQKDPVQTLKTSIQGSINLLGLAKRTKARILQASTSEVYGDPEVSPQAESYLGRVNTTGIRACYDEGKRAAETLFVDYFRQHNVDIRIARIFNTYGPGMAYNDGRVVSNFIVQCLQEKDITLYGDGSQTRSFCFVDDLIDGLINLFFESDYNFPVNLGNPEEITIGELATEIKMLTKSRSLLTFTDLPLDDPTNRKPDINLAKSLLNWHPKTSRSAGLIKTIDYFKESRILNSIR